MSVKSTAVSVGTTATRLDTVNDSGDSIAGESCAVYNNGSATIYLGGADVTASNGVPVAAASWGPGLDLSSGDALYGIVATGTQEARVIETGI